jgi:hypothetical protein
MNNIYNLFKTLQIVEISRHLFFGWNDCSFDVLLALYWH